MDSIHLISQLENRCHLCEEVISGFGTELDLHIVVIQELPSVVLFAIFKEGVMLQRLQMTDWLKSSN